jgi:hypothetical protein
VALSAYGDKVSMFSASPRMGLLMDGPVYYPIHFSTDWPKIVSAFAIIFLMLAVQRLAPVVKSRRNDKLRRNRPADPSDPGRLDT